jgi:hypothetical protein
MDRDRFAKSAATWGAAGAIAIAVWVLSRVAPVFHGYTIPRLQALCNSGLGQIGQALSQQAANDCNAASIASTILNLTGIAGLAAVAVAIFVQFQKPSHPPTPHPGYGQPPPSPPSPPQHPVPTAVLGLQPAAPRRPAALTPTAHLLRHLLVRATSQRHRAMTR